MGLAASQCRLLFITQRQNDVSAKMQRISMDRLSLARDEDDIETKYNRMLNATKFEVKDGVSLSYDSLMNVSNAEMYVITDSNGRVVLNSSKASLYGIPSNKPQGNSGEFSQIAANSTETKFISRLMNLPENDVAQIIADGSVKWENSPEYQTFLQTNGTCPEKGNEEVRITALFGGYWNSGCYTIRAGGDDDGNFDCNGNMDDYYQCNNGIGSLLSGSCNSVAGIRTTGNNYANNMVSDYLNTVAGSYKNLPKVKEAIANTKAAFPVTEYKDGDHGYSWNDMYSTVIDKASNSDVVACVYKKGDGEEKLTGVDLKRVLSKFLTYLGASAQNSDGKIQLPKTNNKGLDYDTWMEKENDAMERWSAAQSGLSPEDRQKLFNLQTIYNSLKNKGWVVDNDTSSLQTKLENGTYYLNGKNAKTIDKLYDEVVDTDMQKQAEAWYKAETKKIKRKEDAMDMENTKLQTEYQALATDIASVQQILNSNIQKSFQYCQSA